MTTIHPELAIRPTDNDLRRWKRRLRHVRRELTTLREMKADQTVDRLELMATLAEAIDTLTEIRRQIIRMPQADEETQR